MATFKIMWNSGAPNALGRERTVEARRFGDSGDYKWIDFYRAASGPIALRVRSSDVESIEIVGPAEGSADD